MTVKIRVLTDESSEASCENDDFAQDVMEGLSKESKAIPCKYFYDKSGGELFRKITELTEYYLTDCEFEILHKYKDEIMNRIGNTRFNLIELGAGDGKKTKVLINHFLRSGRDIKYIPIDICHNEIANLIDKFNDYDIEVPIDGLVADYLDGINWLSKSEEIFNLALFLGSNIGNFDKEESEIFLKELFEAMTDGDYLLIGFDLKKDIDVLNNAYNDTENVTAEFNLNLLRRINRELGADFDPDQFKYVGYYDEASGAIESYLVSQKSQEVTIGTIDRSFKFNKGERIHTENSYKFTVEEISELAHKSGFLIIQNFTDSKNYFMDSLWRVKK